MDKIYATIAGNIKRWRKIRGMSQEKLAEAADLSRNYISLVETGQERIGMHAFIRIKRALGVSACDLFGDCRKQ